MMLKTDYRNSACDFYISALQACVTVTQHQVKLEKLLPSFK
jgi:hypothetical protein